MCSWLGNLDIYVNNLSFFYILCVSVSFVAVIATWLIQNYDITYHEKVEDEKEDVDLEDTGCEETNLVRQFKRAQRNALEQKILASFTEDQLEEERVIEKAQLAAIFQLLSEEKEKFQVSSMEELEDQLKLYRH